MGWVPIADARVGKRAAGLESLANIAGSVCSGKMPEVGATLRLRTLGGECVRALVAPDPEG